MIEITAGIGSFLTDGKPTVTISNKNIQMGDDGTAHYSFRSSSEPGKHAVLVKIVYTDQDGNENVIEKNLEYTVAN